MPSAGLARRCQVNTTDPESRIMTTRRGWVQGYNVQLAVTGDQMIVACSVGQSNDMGQFVPMMTATEHARTLIEAATGTLPPDRYGAGRRRVRQQNESHRRRPGPADRAG